METNRDERIMNCTTLDELLDVQYGKVGTPERDEFDKETQAFCLAATLKEERLRAGLTQEQLAERIGTKKTYISRLENGKADVQLSTLFRIFEGLGRRVSLTIL
jgi:HTH-type transcriptional regulator/antitoxin HipB